jgi:hypothetical protein
MCLQNENVVGEVSLLLLTVAELLKEYCFVDELVKFSLLFLSQK